MFQKLIDFFQSLFKGSTNDNTTTPPIKPDPPVTPPVVDEIDDSVSDGSDLLTDPDTIGTVVFPEELEILPTEPVDIPVPEVPPVDIVEEPVVVVPPVVEEPVIEVNEPEIPEPVEPVVEVPDTPVVIPPIPEVTEPVTPEEPEEPKHEPRFMWCLDNGHGKFTAGKRSPKFEDGSRFFEYEFNRDIVKRITSKLDEKGVKYFNVVPEVDTDNFLKGRVDRANAFQSDLPKLYISIHSNAAPSQSSEHWAVPGAKGLETWYYTGSNRGKKLASIFQKHMVNFTGMVNRGLKSTKKLYVLKNTKMSACLTENGFYNHQGEAHELMKDEVRQSVADAHIAAIMEIEKDGI